MIPYTKNKNCPCVRCRAHGMMGAAVLITLGVLFLMENYGMIPFYRSFPVLLLVIGCVLLVSRTGSMEGHIQPGWTTAVAPAPAPPPQTWTTGSVPPPPPTDQNDSQVKP
jgi:hypothetical protein